MDVAAWLKNLGLGQYEAAFSENAIDGDLLPSLTAEDLRDLGVAIVGHRRKLLDAIAALGALPKPAPPAASGPPDTLSAPGASSRPQLRSGADAERRPITVMFCDLVGSTALASRLDAEDWRSLVNAYLDEASAAVIGLGGHVLKRLGDGLMALFGYPSAQENDAERAVRAALVIQRVLSEINARNASKGEPLLSARIGLESGPVVVETAGEVFGDAPNIAARVQAAADPGSVLVTRNVQLQVTGLFVVEDQGARELRGISEPVQLFRIIRASGAGRRGGARSLTPFVGRDEELGLLARRWEIVRAGEGQLMLIVGEPGLGKSRLIEEFHARLAETPHTWVEWSASQLLQNTPLHPIYEWGRLRFGPDAPVEQRLADLEDTLRLVGLDPVEHTPLLAPLVDIPLPQGREAAFAPEEMRRRQLAALIAWVVAGARSQPVVLAFEDLQWADPTSLDLLRALAERGGQAPLFLIATSRPEFRPSWGMRSHHSAISLAPLKRVQVYQMVGELASRHALSKDLVEGVSERTGGVPLFIEEVTRLLMERGEVGGVQAIPPTLQQSLAARLDRLGPAREVAQIGAALGREFAYPLLRDVAELDESALQGSLERLLDADLLFVDGAPPQATYRFKHALIQDAAYESLLKSRRQALHRHAAEALLGAPDHELELVAHHFTQAGETALAIEWWGKAGDAALRRSAFQEAIVHLGKAIAMADKEAVSRQQEAAPGRIDIHANYARALQVARGYAAPATEAAYARVAEASARRADTEHWLVLYGRWTRRFVAAELRAALEDAESQLREAETAKLPMRIAIAHRMIALTNYQLGSFAQARDHAERAIENHDERWADSASAELGVDHLCTAEAYLAASLSALGKAEMAADLMQRAERRAEDIGQPLSLAHVLTMKVLMLCFANRPKAVLRAAEALKDVVAAHGIGAWEQFGRLFLAWARGLQTDARAHVREAEAAASALREQGARLFGEDTRLLAELEAAAGATDAALALLAQGVDLAQRQERGLALPSLHRLRGDILFARDIAAAEDAYHESVRVAREQGARSFVLLAALPLAKLYQSTGRPVEAHDALVPALEGFAPTPEMPEIAEAQALLAALAGDERVREALEKRQARAKMHIDYARAMQWAKGWGSEEARRAVERAHEFAAAVPGNPEYWSLAYGRFAVSLLRGEFRGALEIAETYLRQAETEGRPDHAVNAHRMLGTVKFELGAFFESRQEFEKLLADWNENRDKGLATVTGADVLCVGSGYMAQLMIVLGNVEDAVRISEGAIGRAESLGDFGSLAFALGLSLFVLAMCGRIEDTLRRAEAFEVNASEKGARLWVSIAREWASWARGLISGDAAAAATEFRDIMAERRERQERQSAYVGYGLLAQLQGKAGAIDAALASIAEGLALAERTGHRADSFLHRVRGDILAEHESDAAEAAYREALRIAQSQGARTFELQAAHALAKLLERAGRPADAATVLAPALGGFASTPEMPEVAEAQALMKRLA